MRFFVPRAETPAEAERVWTATRQFLSKEGLPSEPRKIWKVAYKTGGQAQVLKVGDTHPEAGEEVLLILKAEDGSRYFICTPSRGVIGGRPCTLANIMGQTLAVEFH